MTTALVLIFLGSLIFLAHLFNVVFHYTKLPSVMFLMMIGIVIGPILHLISPEKLGEIGNIFTTVTLIVILFESGTGLSFENIKATLGRASILTLANFLATGIILFLLLQQFTDLGRSASLFLAASVSGTASTVAIPMIKQLRLGSKAKSMLLLETAFGNVLSLMLGLAFIDSLERGRIDIGHMLLNLFLSFTGAILFGSIIGLFWGIIHQRFLQKIDNMMFTSFALAFIIYGASNFMNINGGIAVLFFGIILGNIETLAHKRPIKKFCLNDAPAGIHDKQRSFFSEIAFIMQTYFFVYVGMSLKFQTGRLIVLGLGITVLIYLVRLIVSRIVSGEGISKLDTYMISAMGPRGLVSAVLGSLAVQKALPNGSEMQDIIYSVVFFTIVFCSLLVMIYQNRLGKRAERMP